MSLNKLTARLTPQPKTGDQKAGEIGGASEIGPGSSGEVGQAPVAAGTTASRAAQKALGFSDDARVEAPRTAGARSATHGLSFFERSKQKLRKGVLAALLGITAISAAGGTLSPPANFSLERRAAAVTMRVQASTEAVRAMQGQGALADAQLVLAQWEAEKQLNPGFEVTAQRAQELVLAALLPAAPGQGEDLAAFAKAHLGNDTRQVLGMLLDGSGFKLSDEGRALFEVAAGRAVAVSADGKVTITGDQEGGKIRLTGVAGAQVEAINLSTIPTKRLTANETFVVGNIGADGTFVGDMAMHAGDLIKLRLQLPDGTNTKWVEFRATGLGEDTRNAEVALFRVGLTDKGNGKIDVTNINSSRTISEPGATLRFVNTRTSEATDVTLNPLGQFDSGTVLPGAAGDTFSVRITDGKNDKDLAIEVGQVKVGGRGSSVVEPFNLPDPGLHRDELDSEGKPKFSLERFRGPLFDADGAKASDVQQGQIGNCYLPAAIAAIAHHKPGFFEEAIRVKEEVDANGVHKVWYEVRFYDRTWQSGGYKYTEHWQAVDADLFVRSYGGPLYGSDDGPRGSEEMELWWPILEKAYAAWKGDYNTIGDGGHVSEVFKDVLGAQASSLWINGNNADAVWKQIVKSVDAKQPIGAGTHGSDQSALYANTGVYANHAYSIFSYEVKDGEKYVELRNPWGESEPYPGDGKNDGVFKLKLDTFLKLYSSLYYVTGN
jgi:hypothetical protein